MQSKKSPRTKSGTAGYWASLSDADLLARDTRALDPESLTGLLERAPPLGGEVPEIEPDYDTRETTGRKVRCAHCRATAPNHNVGYVMRFSDGRRMLIGNVCATEHYGVEFTARRGEFEKAVKRGALLKRRKGVVDGRLAIDALFEEIEAHRCWEEYRQLRKTFDRAFFDLVDDLSEAARRRDGMLFALIQVEDVEAEASFKKRTGRDVPIKKRAEGLIHTLHGRAFFSRGRDDPKAVVANCVRRAKSALWALDEKAGTNSELENFFRGMGNLFDQMRAAAEEVNSLPRAFSQENIAGISEWLGLQSVARGHLYLVDGKLFRASKIDGPVRQAAGVVWGSSTKAEMQLPKFFPAAPMAKIEGAYQTLMRSESFPAR